MKPEELTKKLTELRACSEAIQWQEGKDLKEVINTCHRGDWLLWLAKRVDVEIRPLTLACGKCAETVIHLMKDDRSKEAVKAAISFGEGKISEEELNAAADAAYAAYAVAYAAYAATASTVAYVAVAYAASYAAYAAAYAASAADATYAAANAAATAANAATATASAAKEENQLKTANICREILGDLIIEKLNQEQ